MAQTNFTPILLYASSTAAAVPSAANLTNSATGSEIAINVADKNLFFKDSTNAVNTVPIRQSSTSSNGWLSSTDWNTFNGKQAALVSGTNIKTIGGVSLLGSGDVGTLGVAYGGTGLTSLTASYIPYGNGTSAFSSSANLQFDGTNLSVAGTTKSGAILNSGLEAKITKTAYVSVGSAAVTFTVTLPSNADWTPGVIKIEAAATDRTTAGFCSAWWQYVNIILDASAPINAVSDSGGTIASYTVVITGNSGTGSQVITIVVTALLLDYLTCSLSMSGALGITSIS
jgi:hypothetical protein